LENLDLPQKRVSFFELRAVSDEIEESFGFDQALIYHRFEKSGLRRYGAVGRKPSHKEKSKVSIQEKDNGHTRKEKRA
jgi:hypothetical protein